MRKLLAIVYFLTVLYITLISRIGNGHYDYRNYYNLNPLNLTANYKFDYPIHVIHFLIDFVGNIVMFIPYAVCFYFLTKQEHQITIMIAVFLSTVCIELIQYSFYLGVLDMGDVFLNTIGGYLGLIILNKIKITGNK